MLVIRFQRVGRRNDPAFRLVVVERRSKPKSGAQEILGSYHPKTKIAVLNSERIVYWISKGADVSATARNLLISKGVIKGKKIAVGKAVSSAATSSAAAVAAVPVAESATVSESSAVQPVTAESAEKAAPADAA